MASIGLPAVLDFSGKSDRILRQVGKLPASNLSCIKEEFPFNYRKEVALVLINEDRISGLRHSQPEIWTPLSVSLPLIFIRRESPSELFAENIFFGVA